MLTGTGNVGVSASPTFSGMISGVNASLSGTTTLERPKSQPETPR